ncbi:ABC transporter substrate-binding protein [Nocardia sp. NPDC051030]|uniref:ABC transporter substrate-binding protein n=1 Tax=Nocardia sp. NPDC051030 TaxID=3155162 RepID=UPI00341690FA
MVTRRAALRAGVILPLLGACAPDVLLGDRNKVRIAVPWSGFERQAFDAVVHRTHGSSELSEVQVIPLGDDIDTAFAARGSSAPEIVMLAPVGRIRELLDDRYRLQTMDTSLWQDADGQRYSPQWPSLVGRGSALYGVPFKLSLKSLIWYDRQTFDERGLPDPSTWPVSEWPQGMAKLASTSVRLLAFGAADGFVITDFFENVLLAASPDVYAELENATGDRKWDRSETKTTLHQLGELWGHPAAFPGGAAVAMTRQFPDAIREVFEHRRAAMVVAPDFAESVVRRCLSDARRGSEVVGIARFPPLYPGGPQSMIAGADVMVLTERAGKEARQWLAALAAPQAPEVWIDEYGGFLSPNRHTLHRTSKLLESFASDLDSWSRFDLSDRISWGIGRLGLQRTLADFLVDVAGGKQLDDAVADTLTSLIELERRRPR